MSQPSQGKPSGQRTQTRERDDAPAQSSAQEQPTGQAVARVSTGQAVAELQSQIDERTEAFATQLPAHMPVERFKRVVLTAIQRNPKLALCDRRSFFNACMQAANDGLMPDGREGAIVDYKDNAKQMLVAQWMPMVFGIRKKMRNSGALADVNVQAVFQNDAFDYELGDEPFIAHKPTLGDPGALIAVYSIARYKDGTISREVMTRAQCEKIRAISKAKSGPWSNPTFYPEMCKKTVLRRHAKQLPMSSDLDDLVRRDDSLYALDEAGDRQVAGPRPRLSAALAAIGNRPAVAGAAEPLADDADLSGSDDDGEDRETTTAGQASQENREPETADDGKRSEKAVGGQNAAGATSDAAEAGKPAGDGRAQGKAAGERKAEPADDRTPQRVAFDEGADAKAKGRLPSAMPAEYGEAGAESLRLQWRRGHKGDAWAGEIEAA